MGPTLETPRLVLRPPNAADFEPWVEMMQDPEVTRHLGGVSSAAVSWRAMAMMIGAWTLRGFSMFSVIEKASGEWIGRIGPWQPEGWPGREVGWALRRASWGQGLAAEAAAACLDWVFGPLGWDEVIHCIAPDNDASIKLAERLGSSVLGEGRLPAPLDIYDILIYGQTREEWQTRKR